MVGPNEILVHGEGADNVITQDEFQASTTRTSGFKPGMARAEYFNKLMRQLTRFNRAIGKLIADNSEYGVQDNGDINANAESIKQGIHKALGVDLINEKLVQHDEHLADDVKHITSSERTTWNGKLNKAGDTMTGNLNLTANATTGNSPKLSFEYARYIALEAWNLVISNYNSQDIVFKDDQKERMRIKADGSITANGAAISRFNKGFFTDTTTVVPANSTYTKTIPIGFNGQKGHVVLQGINNSRFAELFITTNASEALSIWTALGNAMKVFTRVYNGHLTDSANGSVVSSGSVEILDAYISGSNLIIVFSNTSASAATLNIPNCLWEVQG